MRRSHTDAFYRHRLIDTFLILVPKYGNYISTKVGGMCQRILAVHRPGQVDGDRCYLHGLSQRVIKTLEQALEVQRRNHVLRKFLKDLVVIQLCFEKLLLYKPF